MHKSLLIALLLFIKINLFAQVELRDTIIYWDQFEHSLDQYYSIESYSSSEIEEVYFDGIVLENELVKICLVPEYGARILSFVYKPTGHEQLYQNPVGVPYAINSNIFYHDWLMVYGGIFPTFPEPEHGKYWNVPWNYEVLEESEDKITVSMWIKDDLNNPNHPGPYNNGETGITCYFDVSLEKGKPTFDVDVRLENDGQADNYEYWTCITFTPGSEIDNTFSPSNSEIIVPIDYYQVGWNPNGWMQNADEKYISGNPQVNVFENLKYLDKWEEQGIAYAYPSIEENHYGVINHENEEGLFRLSNDQAKTPGMKFWTWGDQQGLDADPNDFNDVARPYIELWSGVSHEFFHDANLGANKSISWEETYFSTSGIPDISYIDKQVAFYHELSTPTAIETYCFLPVSDENLTMEISLSENSSVVWSDMQLIGPDLVQSAYFKSDFLALGITPGIYELKGSIAFDQDARYTFTETIYLGVSGIEASIVVYNIFAADDKIIFEYPTPGMRRIQIFDMQGKLVYHKTSTGMNDSIGNLNAGIYVVHVLEGTHIQTQKIWVN